MQSLSKHDKLRMRMIFMVSQSNHDKLRVRSLV
jgi:hypothetical protein